MLGVDLCILDRYNAVPFGRSNAVPFGKTVTLRAKIKSNPAPSSIFWTRNMDEKSKEIHGENSKFLFDNSDASCPTLTIENFDFCDRGCYSITVSNSVKTVSADVELKLDGK